jgi:hypothetical protein
MPLVWVVHIDRTRLEASCRVSREYTRSVVGSQCVMYDFSDPTTCGLRFAGSTLSSACTTVKVFVRPWLSTAFKMTSPSSSTSSSAESTKTTKSATLLASSAASISLLTTKYWIFCLKRSTFARTNPASGTSSSMSSAAFKLRTADAEDTSEHRGMTATMRGALSLPAKTLVALACSLSLLMRICFARLRRSNFDMTCWCGVLRLPRSNPTASTLPAKLSALWRAQRRKGAGVHTLAHFLERTFGGMARLEALPALLRRAAVVVVFGSHIAVAAAAGLESERNRRRHFECDASETLRCCCSKCGTLKIVDPLLNIFSGALVLSSALRIPWSTTPQPHRQ